LHAAELTLLSKSREAKTHSPASCSGKRRRWFTKSPSSFKGFGIP
jgi:hypothetical protein